MLKKTRNLLPNFFCLFSFILLISATGIIGPGATPGQAASKAADSKTTAPSTATATVTALDTGTKININTADKATLATLPNIGPVKAQAIIAGRPYKSVEDILKINGIKDKTFAAIKNYITVK